MAPLRKTTWHDDTDELLDSGPVTMRSARFEVAAPLPLPLEGPAAGEVRSSDERSGVMPVANRLLAVETVEALEAELSAEAWSVDVPLDSMEILFDEEVAFLNEPFDLGDHEPDTVRMPSLDRFDTEPPPPTLRSSQR